MTLAIKWFVILATEAVVTFATEDNVIVAIEFVCVTLVTVFEAVSAKFAADAVVTFTIKAVVTFTTKAVVTFTIKAVVPRR